MFQLLSQKLHGGANSRLYRAERLLQFLGDLALAQAAEVCQLYRLTLFVVHLGERLYDRISPFEPIDALLGIEAYIGIGDVLAVSHSFEKEVSPLPCTSSIDGSAAGHHYKPSAHAAALICILIGLLPRLPEDLQ